MTSKMLPTRKSPCTLAVASVSSTYLTNINRSINIGIVIESTVGNFWLVGTAVEHNHLYNYQLVSTKNIFASMLQTETPYYQPTPNAVKPFPLLPL